VRFDTTHLGEKSGQEAPLLIDKWQIVYQLWSHVRREVDTRQRRGQFILTGSAVPVDEITRDSAAGRVARIRTRPMSLFEVERAMVVE